jgi:agmatinase
MATGNMYGPDFTFLGVPRADLADPSSYAGADVVIVGAPFDGGTSHRPGTRFGPQAIRAADYLPHDGSRPSLALRVDPLREMRVVDVGDVEMPSGDTEASLQRLEDAVAAIAARARCRSCSAATTPSRCPTSRASRAPRVRPGVGRALRRARRHGRRAVGRAARPRDADAPADRVGCRAGDRFLQIGLRGYWPEEPTLQWMAGQRMRSYEMTEVVGAVSTSA